VSLQSRKHLPREIISLDSFFYFLLLLLLFLFLFFCGVSMVLPQNICDEITIGGHVRFLF
jgi:hypothetical protein